ncbi:MAG TPA: hypothetical protein VGL09_18725 [Methylomirabilota bacterium]|jgi:hypothetical protein
MPDHWGYVVAAYGLAAVALAAYWRRLLRRDRELTTLRTRRPVTPRSQAAPLSAHPRPEPTPRPPLQ